MSTVVLVVRWATGILSAWVRSLLATIFNSSGKSRIQTWLNFYITQSNDFVQPTKPGLNSTFPSLFTRSFSNRTLNQQIEENELGTSFAFMSHKYKDQNDEIIPIAFNFDFLQVMIYGTLMCIIDLTKINLKSFIFSYTNFQNKTKN